MSNDVKFDEALSAAYPLEERIHAIYGEWGYFTRESARMILIISQWEAIAPELLSFTWMNESVFSFHPEPNKNLVNEVPSPFSGWDVGPLQINVRLTKDDINVKFVSDKGLTEFGMFGSESFPFFDGNPMENARIAARRLKAMGRAELRNDKKEVVYPKVTIDQWKQLSEFEQNQRRATAYVGPRGRNWRSKSYMEFAPLFKKFFSLYEQSK
jgi:hypothetical protein